MALFNFIYLTQVEQVLSPELTLTQRGVWANAERISFKYFYIQAQLCQ